MLSPVQVHNVHRKWASKITKLLNKPLQHLSVNHITVYLFIKMEATNCLTAIFENCGSFPINDTLEVGDAELTPFHYAISRGNTDIVKLFLQHAERRNIDF